MHTHSLAKYMKCIDRDDWPGVGELMLSSAHRLAKAGADFLVCPDNTIHQGLPWVIRRSPLPWLHIAEVVAAQAAERGFRRLGIIGTRYLVDGEVYPEKLTARASGTCGRTPRNARKSIASSSRNWLPAFSDPKQSPASSGSWAA